MQNDTSQEACFLRFHFAKPQLFVALDETITYFYMFQPDVSN